MTKQKKSGQEIDKTQEANTNDNSNIKNQMVESSYNQEVASTPMIELVKQVSNMTKEVAKIVQVNSKSTDSTITTQNAIKNKKSLRILVMIGIISISSIVIGIISIAKKILMGHMTVFDNSMDTMMVEMSSNRTTMMGLGFVGIIAGVIGLMIVIWMLAKERYSIKLNIVGKSLTIKKIITLVIPILGSAICSSISMAFNVNLNDLNGIAKLLNEELSTVTHVLGIN